MFYAARLAQTFALTAHKKSSRTLRVPGGQRTPARSRERLDWRQPRASLLAVVGKAWRTKDEGELASVPIRRRLSRLHQDAANLPRNALMVVTCVGQPHVFVTFNGRECMRIGAMGQGRFLRPGRNGSRPLGQS